MVSDTIEMTLDEWRAEGAKRFGPDEFHWRFVCPACGHVASAADWKAAGASSAEVAFSCVGRHLPQARRAFGETGPGPCDYAGGGLFAINPVAIIGRRDRVFAFAEAA